MDLRGVFINGYGRLHSGWRLVLFVLTLIAVYLLFGGVIWFVYSFTSPVLNRIPHAAYLQDLAFRLLLVISALVAGYLCNRFIEGLPWRALGLVLHKRWLRDFVIGTATGVAFLTIAVGIATAGGGLRFSFSGGKDALLAVGQTLLSSAILFIVAALAEEAMFRGYPLQTMCRSKLAWLGIFLTSVPFATVHLWNPNVVPFVTFANTALAGIWLGVAYIRTRSLWFPLGVHWAWNWALGSLFGLPVSGLRIVRNSLLLGSDLGPAWLTGGSYGIEGGAACTIALLLSTLFIWRTRSVSADPELLKLTSEEKPATPSPVLTIRPADQQI